MPADQVSINVKIKLLGFLEQFTGRKTLIQQVSPGCTVAEIIQIMIDLLGSDCKHALLDSHGNLNGGIEVVLNREHISAYQLDNIRIWEDSELILVPIIAGGARQSQGFLRERKA
jgi:hypothetical protein